MGEHLHHNSSSSTTVGPSSAARPPPVHILHASATGAGETLSGLTGRHLSSHGADIRHYGSLSGYDLSRLPADMSSGHVFVFFVSTCGDGDAPRSFHILWSFLRRASLPSTLLSRLRFVIFGLGDRAYLKFNAVARRLQVRLQQLGARPLLPVALGDDGCPGGHFVVLLPWLSKLSSILCPSLSSHTSVSTSFPTPFSPSPRFDVRVLPPRPADPAHDPHHDDRWHRQSAGLNHLVDAIVVVNRCLTDPSYAGDDRAVHHIELDISSIPPNHPLHSHQPGQVLEVLPRNRVSAVDAFFSLTSLDPTLQISVTPSTNPLARFCDATLNLHSPCTLRSFISAQCDLSGSPRQPFLQALAHHATNPTERDRLQHLASAMGLDDYVQYVVNEHRTLLMVIRDFPSVRPSVQVWINILPRLRARLFSLASCSSSQASRASPRLHLCVAVVKYTTVLKFVRVGVCSSFLQSTMAGDVVPVALQPATSLQFRPYSDAICVGAGTGVAPMRAFLSHCASAGSSRRRMLVVGCRHELGDYLYKEDWKKYKKMNALHEIVPAFSRMEDSDKRGKVYVQDRLQEHGTEVWKLLQDGASVYVAGSAGGMPRGVRQSLVEICERDGGEKDGEMLVRRLEAEGRLQMECW